MPYQADLCSPHCYSLVWSCLTSFIFPASFVSVPFLPCCAWRLGGEVDNRGAGSPDPFLKFTFNLSIAPDWLPASFLAAAVAPKETIFYGFLKPWLSEYLKARVRRIPFELQESATLAHCSHCPLRGWAVGECWWEMGPPTPPADTCLPLWHPEALCENIQ